MQSSSSPALCEKRQRHAPIWSWANLISVDAVAVGVVWNVLFTTQFCARFPHWYESVIIGLSIWLVYTADRLFDANSLDLAQPHSARHRFHLDHRVPLSVIWILLLLANASIITLNATPIQLRWGCLAIALAISYVAAAQWLVGITRYFPKELQVGCVFAFGTSLTAWANADLDSMVNLAIATTLTAVVFSMNCIVIARRERVLDVGQGFRSVVTENNQVVGVIPWMILVHVGVTLSAFSCSLVTFTTALAIVSSDGLLYLLMCFRVSQESPLRSKGQSKIWIDPIALYADLAILVPPMILVVLTALLSSSAVVANAP